MLGVGFLVWLVISCVLLSCCSVLVRWGSVLFVFVESCWCGCVGSD